MLGYPHAKFQNNPVIFDWSRIFPQKIGQLGTPKPLFLVWIKNKFYLVQGCPHAKFQILNLILVDPIRPSLGRKLVQHLFFKPPFVALSKIGDQIWKYIVKDHGFLFLKWCDTSQFVQWFGC